MERARLLQGVSTKRGKLGITMVGLAASAVLIIAACGGAAATSTPTLTGPASGSPTNTNQPISLADTGPASLLPAGQPAETVITSVEGSPSEPVVAGVLRSPSVQFTANQQVGIWVTGRGTVTANPDLVVLRAGVEARATTVQVARTQAAEAMDLMRQALDARGIATSDVQTQSFNISPEYVWNDREKRQELVGFRVTNNISVKVRDIGNVGVIIDEVAEAGGDLARIQGISFTVEDTKALESQAREKAVQDLTAKAQQFADLTNVVLGKLVFLSESGGFIPRATTQAFRAFAEAAPAPLVGTPISGGELEVTIVVQGVFAIE